VTRTRQMLHYASTAEMDMLGITRLNAYIVIFRDRVRILDRP
jgi:hypothetical protein